MKDQPQGDSSLIDQSPGSQESSRISESQSVYQPQNNSGEIYFQRLQNFKNKLPIQLEQIEELKRQLQEYFIQLDLKKQQNNYNEYNHFELSAVLYAVLLINLMQTKQNKIIKTLIQQAQKSNNSLINDKLLLILNQSIPQEKFNDSITEILQHNNHFQVIIKFIMDNLEKNQAHNESINKQSGDKYQTSNVLNTLSKNFEIVIIFSKEFGHQQNFKMYSNDKEDVMQPIVIVFQHQKENIHMYHTLPQNNFFQPQRNNYLVNFQDINDVKKELSEFQEEKQLLQDYVYCIKTEHLFESLITIKYMAILNKIEDNYQQKIQVEQLQQLWDLFKQPFTTMGRENEQIKNVDNKINEIIKSNNQVQLELLNDFKIYISQNSIIVNILCDYELDQLNQQNKSNYLNLNQFDESDEYIFNILNISNILNEIWVTKGSKLYIFLPKQYGPQQYNLKENVFTKYTKLLFSCLQRNQKNVKKNLRKSSTSSLVNQQFRLFFETKDEWIKKMQEVFNDIKLEIQYQNNINNNNVLRNELPSVNPESQLQNNQDLSNYQQRIISLSTVKTKKSKQCKCGAVIDLIYKEYPYCNNCFIKLCRQFV